jgi:hypothetical protein
MLCEFIKRGQGPRSRRRTACWDAAALEGVDTDSLDPSNGAKIRGLRGTELLFNSKYQPTTP